MSVGEQATYQEAMATGYSRYIRAAEGPARVALLHAMNQADVLAGDGLLELDTTETYTRQREETLLYAAASPVNQAIEHPDITQESAQEDTEQEQFIELFERGIEAFYPEGLPVTEKARLFDLAQLANT